MIKLFGEEELFEILLKGLTREEAKTSNRSDMSGHLWFPHLYRGSPAPRTCSYNIISVMFSFLSPLQ